VADAIGGGTAGALALDDSVAVAQATGGSSAFAISLFRGSAAASNDLAIGIGRWTIVF